MYFQEVRPEYMFCVHHVDSKFSTEDTSLLIKLLVNPSKRVKAQIPWLISLKVQNTQIIF